MKRRVSAVAALVLALGVIVGVNANLGSAAPLPGRQHVNLRKICPRQLISPSFVVSNTTDDPDISNDKDWVPEVLDIWITYGRDGAPVPITVEGTNVPVMSITLQPGQDMKVTAVGAQWSGAYYAHTQAWYRGKYDLDLSTRQFCHCEDVEDEPITTTSTSTSTPTSTSTSTTTSTTTTVPPPPTTTTTVGGGGPTTTIEPTTTTTEPPPPTTTTTTVPPTTTTRPQPPSTTTTTGGG